MEPDEERIRSVIAENSRPSTVLRSAEHEFSGTPALAIRPAKTMPPAAPSAASRPVEPLPGGMRVLATVSIALVTAMTVLDTTIANVALPTIAGNLGVAPSQGTLVITFYRVANAIAIPLPAGWRGAGEVRVFHPGHLFLCAGVAALRAFPLAAHAYRGAHYSGGSRRAADSPVPKPAVTCYPPENAASPWPCGQ